MSFTLKSDVFPVGSVTRTIQPASQQPFVDGLEDSQVNRLAVVHLTYRQHTQAHVAGKQSFSQRWRDDDGEHV